DRVVPPEVLDELAVALLALVDRMDAVEGTLVTAKTGETDADQGETPLPGRGYECSARAVFHGEQAQRRGPAGPTKPRIVGGRAERAREARARDGLLSSHRRWWSSGGSSSFNPPPACGRGRGEGLLRSTGRLRSTDPG